MRKKIWRNKYGQPESILSLKRIIGDKEKKFVQIFKIFNPKKKIGCLKKITNSEILMMIKINNIMKIMF